MTSPQKKLVEVLERAIRAAKRARELGLAIKSDPIVATSDADIATLLIHRAALEQSQEAWCDGTAILICPHDSRPGVGWRPVLVIPAGEARMSDTRAPSDCPRTERERELAQAIGLLRECLEWVNVPMQASDAAGLRSRIHAALAQPGEE